ncbi:unnamed protein product, partial [Allacma fusca]
FYFQTDTNSMAKFLLYAVLLVATASAISGVPITFKKQFTSMQSPEILNAFQQMSLSLKNLTVRDSNPGIFAAIGDNCDVNVPEPSLELCDGLDSHMVCYRDNKCGCFDLNKMLTERGTTLPDAVRTLLELFSEDIATAEMHWGTSFDDTRKQCALNHKSVCLAKDIDLNDLLKPPTPIPGLDEISASLNKMKCATNLECKSLGDNPTGIELGKCIDPKVDHFCAFEYEMDIDEYLALCDVDKTNMLCYPNFECGCYDTDKFVTALIDGDERRILLQKHQELKDAGVPLTTSLDPSANNKCLPSKGAACPLGEIDLSKYLGEDFDFLDMFNERLSELVCATNLECKTVDIKDFPSKLGQCGAKKAEDGSCAFDLNLNMTDYLDLCDVTANQVCYKNNKCDCYDTDKFLEILEDMGEDQILRQKYQELKNAGLKLTTSMD